MLTKVQNIALYLFFFSINFEVWDPFNTGGFFSVSKLTGLIYFLTILPDIKQFLDTKFIKPVLIPVWLFFVLLTVISLLNINPISSSFFDFSIFQNLLLFWILINHERRVPGILTRGLFSFALGSIALSLFYNFGIGVEYTSGRVSLFGDNENTIGMRMSISVIIFLITSVQNPFRLKKIRFLLIAAIPLMLKLMAESGSRVAFISFVLMFTGGVLLIKTKKTWYKVFVLVFGGILFAVIIQYVLSSEVLMVRLLKASEEGDLAGRDIIWQKIIPLIKDNPIFGVGKTGYVAYSKQVFYEPSSPHNVIIEILSYTGIVGLIAYLLFVIRSFLFGLKAYKFRKKILPLLLLIPMAGYLLSGQILTNKLGWVIFGYATASGAFLPLEYIRMLKIRMLKIKRLKDENSLRN